VRAQSKVASPMAIPSVVDESVQDALEQEAPVRYWTVLTSTPTTQSITRETALVATSRDRWARSLAPTETGHCSGEAYL